MKYKKVVKTIYLKGEDFVPESLIVEPSDEVRFLNENRNAATIQSKGSLSIADFTLGFGKERTIALENEGRFLFHSAADTSITCTVEVKKAVTKKPQPFFVTSAQKDEIPPVFGIVESKDDTHSIPSKSHYLKFSESHASPPRKKNNNEIVVGDFGSEEADFIRLQRHLFKNFKSATGNIAPPSPIVKVGDKNSAESLIGEGKLSNPFPTRDFSVLETIEHLLIIEDYAFAHSITTVHVGDVITFSLAGSTKAHVEHSLKGTSTAKELCFETGLLQINICKQFSFQPTVPGEIQVTCEVDPDTSCVIEVKENTAPRIRKIVADDTGLTAVAVSLTENITSVEKLDDNSFYDTDDNISDLDVEKDEQQHPQPSSYDKVPADKDFTVNINESGFRPAVIQCERGDSVKFIAQSKHWFCNIACEGMFRNVLLDGDDDHPIYQIQFNHSGVFEVYNQDFHWISCRVEVAGGQADYAMNPYGTISSSVSTQSLRNNEWLMDLKSSSDNRFYDVEALSGSLAQSLAVTASNQHLKKASPAYNLTLSNASPILQQTEAMRLFGSFVPTSASVPKSQTSELKTSDFPSKRIQPQQQQPKVNTANVKSSKIDNEETNSSDGDEEDEDDENNLKSKSKGSKARMAKKRKLYKKKHRKRLRKEDKEHKSNLSQVQNEDYASGLPQQTADNFQDSSSNNNSPKPAMLKHALAMADWYEELDDLPAEDSVAVGVQTSVVVEQVGAEEIVTTLDRLQHVGQQQLHQVVYDHSEDGSMMSSFDPADDCGPFMEFAGTDDDTDDDEASLVVLTPVKEKSEKPHNVLQLPNNFNEEKENIPKVPVASSTYSNNEDGNGNTQVCTPDSGITSNKRMILFSALGLKTPNVVVDMSYLSWTREPADANEAEETTSDDNNYTDLLACEEGQSDWSAEEEILASDDGEDKSFEEEEVEESAQYHCTAPKPEPAVEDVVEFEAKLQDFFVDRINVVYELLESGGSDRFPLGRVADVLRWEDIPFITAVPPLAATPVGFSPIVNKKQSNYNNSTPKSRKKKTFNRSKRKGTE